MRGILAIPSFLQAVPATMPPPPTMTGLQDLPFGQLEWKNFERLCLRLAGEEADIEDCRLYGTQGDDQEGIDIYARLRSERRYRVYQCKRVRDFQPGMIVEAVDAFVQGEWHGRAEQFVLCVADTLSQRKRADALREQTERLAGLGVKLVAWDADGLNHLLKGLPEIVDDFFGRPWTTGFCGAEEAARLGERLDGARAADLRRRLGRLYFNVFRRDDDSYTFRDPSATAVQDLVLPDVLANEDVVSSGEDSAVSAAQSREVFFDDDDASPLPAPTPSIELIEQRTGFEALLATRDSVVLVGDPGTGKSTLLRVLALDLLSSTPQLEPIARRWANFVPLWIPFARWTSLLSKDGPAAQTSLLDAVAEWLRLHDSADLVPLVRAALTEKRVLLLVDGIDEWQSEQDARNAMALLEVFAAERELSVVATCRPRALDLLGTPLGWHVARIAPLSRRQQEILAARTLRRELFAAEASSDDAFVGDRTNAFLRAIDQRPELTEISRTPLLLGLFAHLWFRDERLPENRFAAYAKLVEVLVVTHPNRRITAARIDVPRMNIDVLRRALGVLALAVITEHPSGTIRRSDAARVLEAYFGDEDIGEGLSVADARRATTDVLEHAADRSGILVARSVLEIGFYHRALLEYLAAEAIAAKDAGMQLELVRTRARDQQWHEVIVALAAITPSRAQVKNILAEIQGTRRSALDKLITLPLLGSIAFSATACSPRVAREVADEILDEIEVGTWLPIRERLLEQVVHALHSPSVREIIGARIKRWLPRRPTYRGRLYRTISEWSPQSHEGKECLWRGLHDENLQDARAAGLALFRLAEQDEGLRTRLIELAERSPSARLRAVVLDAAVRADVLLPKEQRTAISGTAPCEELELAAIRARVHAGEQSSSDLEAMLTFARWRRDLDYYWRDDLDKVLAAGWRGSPRLRDVALGSLTAPHGDGQIDSEIARRLLIRAFLDDAEVARTLSAEFDSEHGPFDRDAWSLYAEYARDCGPIKVALDAWLLSPKSKHHEVEAHWAALTTRSPLAKRFMLSNLQGHWPSWAASALLHGWGMVDTEVAEALDALVRGPAAKACELAPHVPDIIPDRAEARRLLLAMLPESERRLGFVVHGLGRTRPSEPEPDIVSDILRAYEKDLDFFGEVRASLFEYWADDDRVVELARRHIAAADEHADLSLAAIAARYRSELRPVVLGVVGVLPARLRLFLAARLALLPMSSEVAASVGAYPHETSPSVRAQCALAHHSRSDELSEADLTLLKREVTKTGVFMEEARAAALAALLRAKRLDVFTTANESSGNPVRLRSPWLRGYNGPFWNEVADNWSLLKLSLGDELFPRLSDSDHGSAETWDSLATVASRSRELAADVIAYAKQVVPSKLGANTLRLLARELPKAASLRELLIAGMGVREPWWGLDRNEDRAVVATELLAESFANDPETLRIIAPPLPVSGAPAVLPVVALASGWPRSDELERLFTYLRDNEIRFHPIGHGALCAVKSSAERVVRIISAYDDYSRDLRRPDIRVVTRLLLRRMREDDDAFEQATEARERTAGANLVVLLRLLAAARGMSDLRPVMEDLAGKELDGRVAPTLARDPFTGVLVPASTLLLEGLLGR